jgi:hypothetical protein
MNPDASSMHDADQTDPLPPDVVAKLMDWAERKRLSNALYDRKMGKGAAVDPLLHEVQGVLINLYRYVDWLRAESPARTLGKLGASKGGKARAAKLTPERRREIATKAVETRWARVRVLAKRRGEAGG